MKRLVLAGLLVCLTQLSPIYAEQITVTPAASSGGGSTPTSTTPISAVTFAPNVTINDGGTHTVGAAPANSPFSGITTLAGLAAITINGIQPFWFLTDNGTKVGPMCTYGTTTNCFTSGGGAYALTNASVSGMSIAWLALEACNLQFNCYRSAGTYNLGTTYAPLMIPNVTDSSGIPNYQPAINISGAGPDVTIITSNADWGSGKRLEWCGDPSGTSSNSLGRYEGNDGRCFGVIRDFSYQCPSGCTVYGSAGASLTAMGGLAWGARLVNYNITARGLNCGVGIVGDHTPFYSLQLVGGDNGLCYDHASSVLTGDLTFFWPSIQGQSQNAIYVDGAASIADTFIGDVYIGAAPVDIGGNSNGCSNLISAMIIKGKLFSEYTGNRVIHDYTATPCRNVYGLKWDNWQNSFSSSNFSSSITTTQELFHVNNLQGAVEIQGVAGEQFAPGTSGTTPVAAFNTHGVTTFSPGYGGFILSGEIDPVIAQLGSIPLFTNQNNIINVRLNSANGWSGTMQALSADAGNYATNSTFATKVGDCIEQNQYNVDGCGRNFITNAPAYGIAMQGGLVNGNTVPIAQKGAGLQLNTGWNSASQWNIWVKSTGIGATVSVTPGTGYANGGPYTWTATAGCSSEPSGTVSVSGGALGSPTVTSQGSGCTAIPTIPIPAGASGGSGGAIAAQWPSGLGTNASTPLTIGLLGLGTLPGGGGTPAAGTGYVSIDLYGLQ